jgi:hypothetical protein
VWPITTSKSVQNKTPTSTHVILHSKFLLSPYRCVVKFLALCEVPPAFCGLPTRRYTWGMLLELMEVWASLPCCMPTCLPRSAVPVLLPCSNAHCILTGPLAHCRAARLRASSWTRPQPPRRTSTATQMPCRGAWTWPGRLSTCMDRGRASSTGWVWGHLGLHLSCVCELISLARELSVGCHHVMHASA